MSSYPSPEQFSFDLTSLYRRSGATAPLSSLISVFISAFTYIYEKDFQSEYPNRAYKLYLETCLEGLTRCAPLIPLDYYGPSSGTTFSQSKLCRVPNGIIDKKFNKTVYDTTPAIIAVLKALNEPFVQNRLQFHQLHLLHWLILAPVILADKPDPEKLSGPDFSRATDVYWKAHDEAYEQSHNYELAFINSPLFQYSSEFVPEHILVPFDIPPEARTRHQWIVGAPGAGKTTFISAMIADDLKKVARNEASIFVMDSQNELIPDIANLEMFAPGRPLHGKLIYLEPDPDFPLALNIFDTNKARSHNLSSKDKAMLESGAIWMVEFFLSSLVKAEASPHQDVFLNYAIPALLAIPNATIFTFKDLLEGAKTKGGETGYDRYKRHFSGLRQDTQDWLRDRMHSPELAMTRNAIRSRLDGFTARGFFHDMFIHPRNKLDLFEEMQTGKVILVNTSKGLLKTGTEPFGRYFIARLLQAAEERMFLARGARLPVYCYIDEASDYIKEEANIEELVNKARKQNVALIIANQMESQITSPIVRDALSRVAIQCRGEPGDIGQPPKWEISIGNREPVQIQVPNVNFSNMPKMSAAHYEAMLTDMRRRFSSPAGSYSGKSQAEPPPRDPPQQDRSGPPKDHEYDDRYDQLGKMPLSPAKARTGTVLTVKCPNGRTHQENIPAGTKNGYRFCVRGASQVRRPDNCNGNFWVELDIPEMNRSQPDNDTDAKPW